MRNDHTFNADTANSVEFAKRQLAYAILGDETENTEIEIQTLREITTRLVEKFPVGSRISTPYGNAICEGTITRYEYDDESGLAVEVYINLDKTGKTTSQKVRFFKDNAKLLEVGADPVWENLESIQSRIRPAIIDWLSKVPRPLDLTEELRTIQKKLMLAVKKKRKNRVAHLNNISDTDMLGFAKKHIADKYGYTD